MVVFKNTYVILFKENGFAKICIQLSIISPIIAIICNIVTLFAMVVSWILANKIIC